MANKIPLVLAGAQITQLQSTDVLAGADTISFTNGEVSAALVIGTPVYMYGTDSVRRAQANALSTSWVRALCQDASISSGTSGAFQEQGDLISASTGQWDAVVTGGSGGLVAGTVYFLDAANPGKLVPEANIPATAGQFIVRIGIAIDTTKMQISLERPIGI
jgi:phage-related tail fiber protein